MREERFDVIVVGLGAMGAAALYQLAKDGAKAVGIDRYVPPHVQGSSHGDTRVTRLAVGEGPAYIPLVRRSHLIWRELEAQSGEDLFEQCGVLVMTSSGAPTLHHGVADFTARTTELARQHGIAHEVLTASQIRMRFPQFGPIRDDAIGYFEPEGGFVRPERCIAAQLNAARELGAVLVTDATVRSIRSEGATVRIKAGDRAFVADKVIVCAGMWSASLLGEPFSTLLKVCRQKLFWFKLEAPSIFPEDSPSFILTHGPSETDACYGFPPIPGEGSMKIATEQYSGLHSLDALDRNVSEAEAEEMFRSHVLGQIAGVTSDLVKASVCAYTVTPDHNFIIDEHPTLANVTVVSACSGHGFKHSAAIGEAVAQRCLRGQSQIDLSAFSLRRFF
ncbi:N-methyl-L-tryptophan oxidase [Caballeronia mineralivorans]|uniref:N-methyl-L-tryptophan oxidase n=1 Tax=Caballeronia mineralivorans TaxID=2010198 RepID=UPI0023F1B57E|nr:N-methyl-L-tryptophan oxidase [Caballeronia mineralivorans]MEA3101391.1 sarcosine oxidase [Caballeronia mineralivorans]